MGTVNKRMRDTLESLSLNLLCYIVGWSGANPEPSFCGHSVIYNYYKFWSVSSFSVYFMDLFGGAYRKTILMD